MEIPINPLSPKPHLQCKKPSPTPIPLPPFRTLVLNGRPMEIHIYPLSPEPNFKWKVKYLNQHSPYSKEYPFIFVSIPIFCVIGGLMEPGREVFSLTSLLPESKQKNHKYKPPTNLVVENTINMVDCEEMFKWFFETYDIEMKYLSDVHLYISRVNEIYGDMGVVVNCIENVSVKGKPCLSIICTKTKETSIEINFPLEFYEASDMEASMKGHKNNFALLGWPQKPFSIVLDEGINSMDLIIT